MPRLVGVTALTVRTAPGERSVRAERGLGGGLRERRDEREAAVQAVEPHDAEWPALGARLTPRDADRGCEEPLGDARRLERGENRRVHADRARALSG